jgi:putative transposase
MGMRNPFRYFNSSPQVIRLTVMMCIRYPLPLREVEVRCRDPEASC